MTMQMDREGLFKIAVEDVSLKTFPGKKSVALNIRGRVSHIWHEDTQMWEDWTAYDDAYIVYTDCFIVKKDGTLNNSQIETVAESLEWDGNMDVLKDKDHAWPDCQVRVEEDTYNGKTRYRGAWLSPINADPTRPNGSSNVDAVAIDQVAAMHGPGLKAIAGNRLQKT